MHDYFTPIIGVSVGVIIVLGIVFSSISFYVTDYFFPSRRSHYLKFSVALAVVGCDIVLIKNSLTQLEPPIWLFLFLSSNSYLCLRLCGYWLFMIAASVWLSIVNISIKLNKNSLNKSSSAILKRKIFHFIAFFMFTPPLLSGSTLVISFQSLALGVAISMFILIETFRNFEIFDSWGILLVINSYFDGFLKERYYECLCLRKELKAYHFFVVKRGVLITQRVNQCALLTYRFYWLLLFLYGHQ
jgi:hypothetical protein